MPTECTSLGPSRERGPSKGYIDAIESRLEKTEALLSAVLGQAYDPTFAFDAAGSDGLAQAKHHDVDNGACGLRGRGSNGVKGIPGQNDGVVGGGAPTNVQEPSRDGLTGEGAHLQSISGTADAIAYNAQLLDASSSDVSLTVDTPTPGSGLSQLERDTLYNGMALRQVNIGCMSSLSLFLRARTQQIHVTQIAPKSLKVGSTMILMQGHLTSSASTETWVLSLDSNLTSMIWLST